MQNSLYLYMHQESKCMFKVLPHKSGTFFPLIFLFSYGLFCLFLRNSAFFSCFNTGVC